MTKRFAVRAPLVLKLGTIAAGGLALSACGEQPPKEVLYNSVQECVSAGVDAQICQTEYQDALQAHVRNAPKFNGQAACEAEYGQGRCMEEPASAAPNQTGSFFVPFMTGYLVSSAISNLSSYAAYRDYRNGPGYRSSSPIFSNRYGSAYRIDPPAVGQPPSAPRPANVNTRTVSRSGFGGLSAGRSGGGSFGG